VSIMCNSAAYRALVWVVKCALLRQCGQASLMTLLRICCVRIVTEVSSSAGYAADLRWS